MKRLIIALAACATTLFASAVTVYEGFESSLSGWGEGGTLTAYDVGDTQKTAANYPFADSGAKYCAIDSDGEFASPAAPGAEFFDMYVQFPAGSDEPSADLGDAKLAVYLNAQNAIVVLSGDGNGGIVTNVFDGVDVGPGDWVRLTIQQHKENSNVTTPYEFRVFINGTSLTGGNYLTSIVPDTKATQVAFEGSGAIDNFVARNKTPFAYADADEAAEDMQYVCIRASDDATDGMYFDSISAGAIAEAKAVNLPITLIRNLTADKFATDYSVAPGAIFTVNANGYSVADAVAGYSFVDNEDGTYTYTRASGWAYYLGPAVDGAYEIDNLTELKAFQENVGTLPTVGETFKLTTDIALDAAWPGIGLQNGKDDYNTDGFNAAAFCGTFDGQNHTISNFQMVGVAGNPKNNGEGLDYCGFFNSIYNATIQNLKIEYAGSLFAVDTKKDTTHESGATFVGVAKSSTLRNLTTLPGTVSCDKGFGGIVGYLTSGTLVDSCTNNVNMTSLKPNKCGGIAMITQGGSAVTIRNCQNNGTIAGSNETGSLVGYIGLDTTIEDCDSTVAYKLLHHQGSTVTVSGITADASVASYSGNATPGLNFATVDNGVATFVADGALALNGSYKVMSGNATATYEFTDVGSIAFNTSLATPTSYAITSSGTAGIPVVTTANNVTTYTAGYFPRTATADQDGSAAHPFEIADLDDLQAFKAAVEARVGYDKNYKLTANIDATSAGNWDGIGTYNNSNTAFTGVLDGDGFTIANLTFATEKYRGFFDQLEGTVKNLTIDVAGIADTSAEEHGYAAFAGNTKNAKFFNCAATGTIGTTAKPAMHTCGGFAVKVTSATSFTDCTNYVDIVCSLKENPKIGGFVGLSQGSHITNCWNYGDMTITLKRCGHQGNGAGGFIGYSQTNASTIHGGGNYGTIQATDTTPSGTVADTYIGTIIAKTAVATTITGGTIAQADQASAGVRANITGLDFATVDNNVATFVSDIESNNTYKVMTDGATATFAFAEAGTIAFDTALFTPTYAITAAEGLSLTDATSGTVKTYTATAAGGLDPSTDKTEVTVKIDDADMSETEVKEAVIAEAAKNVTVPATAEVDATTYLGYFNTTVTGSNGEYTLTLTSLKEEVEEEVEASAITAAQAGDEEATVTTKPGLYYGFVVGESPSLADPEELTLATGASMKVNTKALNGKTAGFVKTVISAKPTMDKQ